VAALGLAGGLAAASVRQGCSGGGCYYVCCLMGAYYGISPYSCYSSC
jgi:hypothetical protein